MSSDAELVLGRIESATRRDRALIRAASGAEMTEPMPEKTRALVEAARILDGAGVGYALIGGVAVGVHSGTPRATLDVDLAVRSTIDRRLVVNALTQAGFTLSGEYPHSVNLRHPGGEPVQLAFDTRFDPMIERAESLSVSGYDVRIVCKDDLIEMKRQAAADPARRRSKALRDQADIELLLGDVPDPDEGW